MIINSRKVTIHNNEPQRKGFDLVIGEGMHQKLIATVTLGNLGLHNASSFYVNKDPKNYPMAWFKDNSGLCSCTPDKPEYCAADETIYMQYDTPLERLINYANSLQKEHCSLTDEQLDEHPHGHFSGRKRSARWYDERLRRGLQN